MSFARALRCRECGREYPIAPKHVCEYCFGPLEVVYDYESMQRAVSRESIDRGPTSLWRYRDMLPIEAEPVDLQPGMTPLIKAKNLGEALGLKNLYIKNDCANPTWSFKDRVVAIASSKAREFGFTTLACASTGNLANAVSAHAARAGMEAFVFVPNDLEAGKLLGSSIYGANLIAVDGSYDDVNRLCAELGDKYKWAFVNINVRPYYSEGSKTLGYEVAEQLGWRAPDHCIVPLASGSLYGKIWKGLHELQDLGLIDEVHTRMSGCQAQGCSPIITAWQAGTLNFRPVRPNTIARSLAIGNPADGYYTLKIMQESNGAGAAVTDEEVVEGIKLLAESEGIFAETAGGVTISGLKQMVRAGHVKPDETVVAFITGGGLKTQEAVQDAVRPPIQIQANIDSFESAWAERRGEVVAAGGPS
jgi:threonine synthase